MYADDSITNVFCSTLAELQEKKKVSKALFSMSTNK